MATHGGIKSDLYPIRNGLFPPVAKIWRSFNENSRDLARSVARHVASFNGEIKEVSRTLAGVLRWILVRASLNLAKVFAALL